MRHYRISYVTIKDVNNNNHHTYAEVNQSNRPKPLKEQRRPNTLKE